MQTGSCLSPTGEQVPLYGAPQEIVVVGQVGALQTRVGDPGDTHCQFPSFVEDR